MTDLEEQRPADIPIVVLDTETTGLVPALGHRVVEIGAIRFERWQAIAEISQLLQPGRKMEPEASSINGIYDHDLVGKPAFGDLVDQLLELTADALLVAHNAEFDAGFLGMEFHILQYLADRQHNRTRLPNPWLCTLRLARRHFYFDRNSLEHVAYGLGVRIGRAHRALNDVYMTAGILKRMIRELERRQLVTVGDLLHAQGGPVYLPPVAEITLPPVILNALLSKDKLRIIYRSSVEETDRIITPLYPSEYGGQKYLIAYCHLRQDQRTFRLDRLIRAWPISE